MDLLSNTVDMVLSNNIIESPDFIEFSESLDSLHSMLTDRAMYLSEEVKNAGPKFRRTAGNIVRNTVDTTKTAGKVYSTATDAGGAAIKSVWDLTMKILGVAAKAIKFVTLKIIKIPETINTVIDITTKIPSDIKNKIRGNIKLYITANDLSTLYDNAIYSKLDSFIGQLAILSKGELWTSFRNKFKIFKDDEVVSASDMQLIHKMSQEFKYFKSLEFNPTVVDMNDFNNVELYFGTGTIKFKDIRGKDHNDTYYRALEMLVKDIIDRKNILDSLYSDLGMKFDDTQANQNFAKLSAGKRQKIVDAIQMVCKTVEIIGTMVRCIMIDIDTIRKTTDQILDRQEKIANGTSRRKIIGRSDDVIKDVDINKQPKASADFIKDMKERGYVRVERYQKYKNATKEIRGIVDKYDSNIVWIEKDKVPRGVKIIK